MKVKFKCDICGKTIEKEIKERKDNINKQNRSYKCTKNCKIMRYYISAYKKKIDLYKIFDPLYWLKFYNNNPEKTISHLKNLKYLKSYFNPSSYMYLPKIIKLCNLSSNSIKKLIDRIKENKIDFKKLKQCNNLNSINRWKVMGFSEEEYIKLCEYFKTNKDGFILRGKTLNDYKIWKDKSIKNRGGVPLKEQCPLFIEYWIKQGFSLDEANKIISKNNKRDINYFVKKFGIIEGTIKYNNMCKKRKKSNSIEGYIEKYGYEKGKEKFDNITKSKNVSLKKQIERYGIINGTKIHNQRIQKMIKSFIKNDFSNGSNIANLFFRNLESRLNLTIDKEVIIGNYICDGLIKEKKLIIEFFGDYWHKNPLYYKENKNLIKYDYNRLYNLKNSHGYNIIIVWESCMKKLNDIIDIVSNNIIKDELNIQFNLDEDVFLINKIMKE